MNTRSQLCLAWAGILCPTIMFAGLWIGGYFPPQSPMMTAQEVADFYQQNGSQVRVGMIMIQIAGGLYACFAAGISAQMRRIEYRHTPGLSYAQLALGSAVVLAFLIPAFFFIGASFRPERAPEVTQALHDMGWLIFVGVVVLNILENVVIGFLIISDKRAEPVFARWVGFANFWIALLLVPGLIMPFFKTGPFAWNGLLSYWLPAFAFGGWFYFMAYHVIKAIKRQTPES